MTPKNRIFEPNAVSYNYASRTISHGGLVSFPTETVYGIGADAMNEDAVAKIFTAKKRPPFNPLIIHLHDIKEVEKYAYLDNISRSLGHAFWPGPFTMVLPFKKGSGISSLVTAGGDTIAIRIPRNAIARKLLKLFGGPIAAPSANLSGGVSPTTAQHVASEFRSDFDDLEMILEGGSCTEGVESTIIQVTKNDIKILRPGSITFEDIKKITDHPLHIKSEQHTTVEISPVLISPGLMKSHYAPNTKIRLDAADVNKDEAMLGFGKDCPSGAQVFLNLSPDGDLHEAAANLFSMIRELDQIGTAAIAVSPIPMTGVGIAINDRLERAAAPKEKTIKKQALSR